MNTLEDAKNSASETISELLPKILQTIPYMVFWKDRESKYIGCNDVFAACAGLKSPNDIPGLTDYDLPWTREEANGYRADDREVMRSGQAKLHIVESQLNADGERTWLDTSKVPLRNANGDVIGVLGIYANITEQKRAQEQLRTTRQYLEDAIETIDAGLVMYDANERFVFCNERYRQLYECPSEILQPGRTYEQILRDWAQQRPELLCGADAEDWIAERLEIHRTPSLPVEQRLSNRVILINDRVTRDGGVVGLRTDITQQKRIESDLREAKEAAEAASHAKTGFLANMSHEIRTPMAAILGFTDVLLDGECSESQSSMLQTIKRNGEHLLALINDILDLSKIEAGKFEISKENVDVPAICREVSDLFSWKANEKGVSLELNLDPNVPSLVIGDNVRIRQIVMNLVGNAIKFTEKGSVKLSLALDGSDRQRWLVIEVRDTGIGMSEEECERVFQPFQQADASTTRRFGGTGLGLTISRRLAELQGGELCVSSELGKGSIFVCKLPCQESANSTSPQVNPQGTVSLTNADYSLTGLSILLAEDGPDNQRLISHVLRKAGADVEVVDNGQKAIDAIELKYGNQDTYHVILMDMQMPVRDGYSAAREISQRWPQLPVAAITAHAMSTDRDECLAAGCCAYLSKPIDRKALLETCAILGKAK